MGLTERSAMTAARRNNYVIGFVFHEQQRMNANSAGVAVTKPPRPLHPISPVRAMTSAGLQLITAASGDRRRLKGAGVIATDRRPHRGWAFSSN